MDFNAALQAIIGPDQHVVQRELRRLSGIDPRQQATFLSAWLRIPAGLRLEIIKDLDALAEESVEFDFRSVFRACLEDPDHEVRTIAVDGLWEDDTVETMQRLIGLLERDPAPQVQAMAASVLGMFAYRAEVEEIDEAQGMALQAALLAVARNPGLPVEVARRVIEALGYFAGNDEAQELVARSYQSGDLTLQEGALVAMGRSMLERWHPLIARELRSSSPALRYEAARAVGEMADSGRPLLTPLLPLVDDDDIEVAIAAIWALGEVGGPQAQRVLKRLAKSNDEARREAAEEALATLDAFSDF